MTWLRAKTKKLLTCNTSIDLPHPTERTSRLYEHSQRQQRILVSSSKTLSVEGVLLLLLLLLLLMMMGMSLLMMRILFLGLMMRMPLELKMMSRYGLVASLVIPVHLLPLITLLPSIIFILLSALLPESPVWLMRFVHPDDDVANESCS